MADGATFITCRKNIKIRDDKSGAVWEVLPGYVGPVPAWVEKHWYFKKLCEDKTIMAIVSTKDNDVEGARLKAEEAARQKQLADEKKVKIAAAKSEAKAAAAKEAADKGLDKTAAKELEAEKIAAAVKAVEDEYAAQE